MGGRSQMRNEGTIQIGEQLHRRGRGQPGGHEPGHRAGRAAAGWTRDSGKLLRWCGRQALHGLTRPAALKGSHAKAQRLSAAAPQPKWDGTLWSDWYEQTPNCAKTEGTEAAPWLP